MFFILGLIVAFGSIAFSIFHLGQSPLHYLDAVGITVVWGGTSAVAIILFPWHQLPELRYALRGLLRLSPARLRDVNEDCMALIVQTHAGSARADFGNYRLSEQVLTSGSELISLGFSSDRIAHVLEDRIHHWHARQNRVATAFRSLSKYPPAFGLVGTVLGLVSLMRAISDGASSTEAGSRMAVALVATLYGLIVANLFIAPIGECLSAAAADEKSAGELALQAVLLAADRISLLEAQESLNACVPNRARVALGDPDSDSTSTPEEVA